MMPERADPLFLIEPCPDSFSTLVDLRDVSKRPLRQHLIGPCFRTAAIEEKLAHFRKRQLIEPIDSLRIIWQVRRLSEYPKPAHTTIRIDIKTHVGNSAYVLSFLERVSLV